MKDQVLEW